MVVSNALITADMKHDAINSLVLKMIYDHDYENGKYLDSLRKEFEENASEFTDNISIVEKLNSNPEFKKLLDPVSKDIKSYTEGARLLSNKMNNSKINSKDYEDFAILFKVLEKSLGDLGEKLEEQIKTSSELKISKAHSDVRNSLIVLGIFFIVGAATSVYVYRAIAKTVTNTDSALLLSQRLSNMVDKSPINTMLATPDGLMTYMNENSLKTLKSLEQYLPDKAANLTGKSIDWFHKNPAHQRRIIGDPKNLPFKSIISVGPEKLDLLVTAIFDDKGSYVGPMVTWDIITTKIELITDLTKAAEDLASSASNVLGISSSLSVSAEETSAQANTASVASEEVNAGVQTVASSMEEMVASIKEITKTTNEASSMSNEAMKMAKNANLIINQLGESSMDIGNVIKVISSIAQQTNLLALNATIEAARAGEAGKGFAVVANEVKELAKQTAKATSDITKKIETIQADSKNAVEAIADISNAIEKVNGYASNIAASVEEQAATTNEVTRIVTESAEGVKQINENISQVSMAAASTGKDASSSQTAAKVVGEISESLKKYVARLKV
jgi:methyl-accepting chemotaxis protein